MKVEVARDRTGDEACDQDPEADEASSAAREILTAGLLHLFYQVEVR